MYMFNVRFTFQGLKTVFVQCRRRLVSHNMQYNNNCNTFNSYL